MLALAEQPDTDTTYPNTIIIFADSHGIETSKGVS